MKLIETLKTIYSIFSGGVYEAKTHEINTKPEKDPLQVGDMKNSTLYIFGESTTEVEMSKGANGKYPFERIRTHGNKRIDRIDIYLYTYLEINKEEFIRSSMYFYEPGNINLKEAYCDPSGDIAHTSPVLADANGRFRKIFIEKPYTVKICDRSGQVVFSDDYV